MIDDWQPGDPIYDQDAPQRTYQQEPMIEVRDDGSSTCPEARWTPDRGWV